MITTILWNRRQKVLAIGPVVDATRRYSVPQSTVALMIENRADRAIYRELVEHYEPTEQ